MIWVLALTVAGLLAGVGYLGNPVNRIQVVRWLNAGVRMTTPILNALGWYILTAVVLLTAASTMLLAAALFHWEVVGACTLMLVGAGIGGTAFAAKSFTGGVLNAVAEIEKEMQELHLVSLHPDQLPASTPEGLRRAIGDLYHWLAKFLTPEPAGKILTGVPRAVLRTVRGIVNIFHTLFRRTVEAGIWIAVLGFGVLYIPESATALNVLVVVAGLALVFVINVHKGWVTDQPWKTSKFWIKTAVYVSIGSMAMGSFKAFAPEFDIATRVAIEKQREELVSQRFGRDYDQIAMVTTQVTPVYESISSGAIGRKITYYPNHRVWRKTGKNFKIMPDGRRYYLCMPALQGIPSSPNPDKYYWIPGDALALFN